MMDCPYERLHDLVRNWSQDCVLRPNEDQALLLVNDIKWVLARIDELEDAE